MNVTVTPPKERTVTIECSETVAALITAMMGFLSEAPQEYYDVRQLLQESELKTDLAVAVKSNGLYRVYNAIAEW